MRTECKVNHAAITSVDAAIFTLTFAPDCMTHDCACLDDDRARRNDACCQHGADVLVPEKAAIVRRAREIASVVPAERIDPTTWFDERDPEVDPEVPGGILVRTATADLDDDSSGCVFLTHTGERGCALHLAAIVHGFDPDEIKPSTCRLYPLSWSEGWLGLSDDFDRYSCARDAGPPVYRLMRDQIASVFGADLVVELDRVEAALAKRRLRVVRGAPAAGRRQSQSS